MPGCGLLWGVAPGAFTDLPASKALGNFERTTGRPADILHSYHRGDEVWPTADEIATVQQSRKRILFANWKVAWDTTWADVAAGGQDARIDRAAARLKAFPGKLFVALHHEPENDVRAGGGMTARDYAAMFRHTVLRLRAAGVTNVVFVMVYMAYEPWCVQPWFGDLYPGDDVVDWIGMDPYLFAKPGGYGHGDFAYLVDRTSDPSKWPGFYTWATRTHGNKPLMIAEWGVYEHAADPAQKAWIYSTVRAAAGTVPGDQGPGVLRLAERTQGRHAAGQLPAGPGGVPEAGRRRRSSRSRYSPSAAAVSVRRADRDARAFSRAAATSPSATGSTTSRYAFSFGSVPDGRTTTRVVPARTISTSASGSRSSTAWTGSSSSSTGGFRRIVAMAAAMSARSSTRTLSWSVAWTPCRSASSSRRSPRSLNSDFSPAASSHTSSAAVMPSLSRTCAGATQYPMFRNSDRSRPGRPRVRGAGRWRARPRLRARAAGASRRPTCRESADRADRRSVRRADWYPSG